MSLRMIVAQYEAIKKVENIPTEKIDMYGNLEKKCEELKQEIEKLNNDLKNQKVKEKDLISVPIYKSDSSKLIEKLRNEILVLKKI